MDWLAGVSAVACVALGALVLLGWTLDIPGLKSVVPQFVTMKANTALSFLLCGTLLWFARRGPAEARGAANLAAQAVAVGVIALAVLTLSEYLFSWNAGTDLLLFHEAPGTAGTFSPGRMAPDTTVAFVAAGSALLLLLRRAPERQRSLALPFIELAGGLVMAIGLLSLFGYAAKVETAHRWTNLTGVALHTTTGLVVLGAGLLAAGWRSERLAWRVGTAATAGFAAGLGTVVFLTWMTLVNTRDMADSAARLADLHHIRARASDLRSAIQNVDNTLDGYALIGAARDLTTFGQAVERVANQVAAIRELATDQPEALRLVREVEPLTAAYVTAARDVILQGPPVAAQLVRTGREDAVMRDIVRHLDDLDALEEQQISAQQAASDAAIKRTMLMLPLGGLLGLVLLAGAVLALNRRIVAQRGALDAARRGEARYRALTQSASDAVVTADGAGRIVGWNRGAEMAFGYTESEILGQPLARLMPARFGDRHLIGASRVLSGGVPSTISRVELAGLHKDQHEFPLELSLSTSEIDGQRFVTAIMHDITARKATQAALAASEERFRLAALAAHDVMWDWNVPANVIWRSDELQRSYGYVPEEREASVDWWIDRIHPEDREATRSGIQAALGAPGEVWEAEYRFRCGDDSYATVLDRAIVLRDADGAAVRLVGVMSDISARVRLEAQLRQSQKLETVGQLAGGIAHDFNNLLTVITTTAELARADLREDDPVRAEWDVVRDASARGAALTGQLLAFSRRQVLQPVVSDLNAIVARIRPMLKRLIGEHVAIFVRACPDLGSVLVDPAQMEQVILNLATNSRDAMSNGGALTIETANVLPDEAWLRRHPGAQPGPQVMLAVSDTGLGMDEGTQSRVFEPFFTTKGLGKGTGLGLATAHGMVRQSGGTIDVVSEPGRGTTIGIYLPRHGAGAADQQAAVAAPMTGGSETILIVEDEDAIRRLTQRILQKRGYTVLAAAGGHEALALLANHGGPIHLVMTDVVMPGMNGRQLADRLAKSHPDTKILFASGYTDDAIMHHGVLDPGTNFLSKPYTVEDLTRKVRTVLDASSPRAGLH